MRSRPESSAVSDWLMTFAYRSRVPNPPHPVGLDPRFPTCECIHVPSRQKEGVMSEGSSPPAKGGELGHRRLGTPAAVAQALAIGPMFSTAIVLGFVSNPVNGAGWNT